MVGSKWVHYRIGRIPLCSEYNLGIGIAEVVAVDVHNRANGDVLEETTVLKHGGQRDVRVGNAPREVEGVAEHGIRASDVALASGPVFAKGEPLAS